MMVMLRGAGKAYKVAKKILEKKGIKVVDPKLKEKTTVKIPTMQR